MILVKAFIEEGQHEWWNDKKFIAEMDKRFKEMENGKVKGLTLEALETSARLAYKKHPQKYRR